MQVIGCDISREMLRQAARIEAGADVRWVHLDIGWRELPFPDASFDAVIAASILEYVAVPNSVLAEYARVLRPSGVLLCTVPDIYAPVQYAGLSVCLASRRVYLGQVPWPSSGPTGGAPWRTCSCHSRDTSADGGRRWRSPAVCRKSHLPVEA